MVLQWSRCVLKSPWLCRLGDASYVMCTVLHMMVLYDRACVGPTTKTSDEISIICLFRLILQANPLFCFICGIRVASSQMLNPYLFQMVFSYSYVNTNPSRSSSLSFLFLFTSVSLLKWIRSFQHLQDQVSVLLNGVCFIRSKLSLFSHPPTLVSSRTQIS